MQFEKYNSRCLMEKSSTFDPQSNRSSTVKIHFLSTLHVKYTTKLIENVLFWLVWLLSLGYKLLTRQNNHFQTCYVCNILFQNWIINLNPTDIHDLMEISFVMVYKYKIFMQLPHFGHQYPLTRYYTHPLNAGSFLRIQSSE